ncbi:MAG: hypothetical protein WAM44_02635 [Chthoniobacterales bacterium]
MNSCLNLGEAKKAIFNFTVPLLVAAGTFLFDLSAAAQKIGPAVPIPPTHHPAVPVVPEANPGLVLIPIAIFMLLLYPRHFLRRRSAQQR